MKKLILMTSALLLASLTGCATNSLVGNWVYSGDNASIGLTIKDKETCELSLSRFLAKDAKKDCRYSESKKTLGATNNTADTKQYLIYLFDANGSCDILPDFEFGVDANAGLLTLYVGDEPFVMQKKK